LNDSWAEPDVRDEVVDYVRYWSDKTGIKATKMIRWIKITRSKYYDWLSRYGKLERYHRTIKSTCIRVNTPLSLPDAQRLVVNFVDHYNNKRLHSAIGYITPKDKLAGRAEIILTERESKLAAAREARKAQRKAS